MATTTLTLNPQKITCPDGNENDINFDNILASLGRDTGLALLDGFSAATQYNCNNQTITSDSGSYSSGSVYLPIKRGVKLKYKGTSSATFNIAIVYP